MLALHRVEEAARDRTRADAEFKAAVVAAWRLDSLKLTEIAAAAGMSPQGVIQLLNRAGAR